MFPFNLLNQQNNCILSSKQIEQNENYKIVFARPRGYGLYGL